MTNGEPIRKSLDQAHRIYQEEDATVLDVVDTDSYEELSYKIEGAVRIDPRDVPDDFERLPKERTVLAY